MLTIFFHDSNHIDRFLFLIRRIERLNRETEREAELEAIETQIEGRLLLRIRGLKCHGCSVRMWS